MTLLALSRCHHPPCAFVSFKMVMPIAMTPAFPGLGPAPRPEQATLNL